jgi:hypothetical protein
VLCLENSTASNTMKTITGRMPSIVPIIAPAPAAAKIPAMFLIARLSFNKFLLKTRKTASSKPIRSVYRPNRGMSAMLKTSHDAPKIVNASKILRIVSKNLPFRNFKAKSINPVETRIQTIKATPFEVSSGS